ncbi:hypothetical protein [Streptomyces liangshanensis]|uniref:Uncharacterized protein n=1 Tax=Streptomyces liangshanensis TaxID=2717324 RepID=A0A6G9GYZ5_9ACTN|nr:hypothetical protein [Streptomyces liangshanensis]QIQ03455.1 hypothetical protein HA039_14890 [Streptomyces liangshanensis]
MPIEEPFEDRIGQALRATGDAFEPPDRSALVDGGLARGRRTVVRRRWAAVTGSVVALAVVGVGGAYGGGWWNGTGKGDTSVALPALSASAKETSGAELTRILTGLLPRGTFGEVTARGPGDPHGALVSGVFDDGKGRAGISLTLTRVSGEPAIPEKQCPPRAIVPHKGCSLTTLLGGSTLRIFQGYEYPDQPQGVQRWQATLVTDRFLVDVTEYNSPAEKGAPVSRPEPPLGVEQLRDLVTSNAWNGPLGELAVAPSGKDATGPAKAPTRSAAPSTTPDPKGAGGSGSAGTAPKKVRQTFLSLLPAGVKVLDQGGQGDEYAYAVVDDGKGAGFVQINVQAGMGDVAGELFGAGSTTLPDGTLLSTKKEPSEKGGQGAVMWTVDTLRPDGLRVVVSALNAAGFHADATREAPVLSIEQLTALATSEKWRTAR